MLASGMDPLDESSISMNLVAACAILGTFYIGFVCQIFEYLGFSLRADQSPGYAPSRYWQAHRPHQIPEAGLVAQWVEAGVNHKIGHALVVRGQRLLEPGD